ncbi:MAG: inositol monophosphatase family protein [Myxococcota bacterium]|nr:inositol monophosphatase family protein [Myxococcota bacterium]
MTPSSLSTEELEQALAVASVAADRARLETLPRFRAVTVEIKPDGSPVTEADRAAERAIRQVLQESYPDFGILGEEYGSEHLSDDRPYWVIDPIDGTIAYARGIPLFSTLIALVVGDTPVVGLIDLPALDERYLGFEGGGCARNGDRIGVSQQKDLEQALVAHGDLFCFDNAGQRPAFERMAQAIPKLRGYTDAFGHAQVLSGGIDAMVDFDLNPWDAAASEVLVREAGGECRVHRQDNGKLGLILGSPALVAQLCGFLD